MSKRARGGTTGGSGDLKPQFMTMALTANTGANVYTAGQFPSPIPRTQLGRDNRASIMEVLKVFFYPGGSNDLADVAHVYSMTLSTASLRSTGETASVSGFEQDFADPRTLATLTNCRTVSTSGGTQQQFPTEYDLTDASGNGVLVATDSLFLASGNVGATAITGSCCKILYRIYDASIMEYVGIVQSQQ